MIIFYYYKLWLTVLFSDDFLTDVESTTTEAHSRTIAAWSCHQTLACSSSNCRYCGKIGVCSDTFLNTIILTLLSV